MDTSLRYVGKGSAGLCLFTDSDWAGDTKDRKSQGGYVVLNNGSPIAWQSRKQEIVALSTLEAEYIACSEATREARFMAQLQRDIFNISETLPIKCDNQGAINAICTGITTRARTKHIDVRYHNSADLHRQNVVEFSYVPTLENIADLLTKGLPKLKHDHMVELLGLRR